MQLLPQAGVVWRFLVFMTILDEILEAMRGTSTGPKMEQLDAME
jgi:hypothetical protein